MKNTGIIFILLFLFLSISACKLRPDKIGLPNYNAEILGPIVKGKYSGTDFIKDNQQFSQVGPDGLVTLIYKGETPELGIEDVIKIPDQQFSISGFPGGNQTEFSFRFPFSFILPNGIQIADTEIRSGSFSVSMSNTGTVPVSYQVRLLHAVKNGSDPVLLSSSVGAMGIRVDSISLSGVSVDMTRGQMGTYNGLELEFILTANGGSTNFLNALSGSTIAFRNFKPRFVRGYLGTYIDTISGNFQVPIFDRFFSGELLFENPYIQANFLNSFGLSARFLDSPDLYISGKNPNRLVQDSVRFGAALRGLHIPAASSPTGPPSSTEVRIEGAGDNFPAFLSIFPSRIRYQLPVRVNSTTPVYSQFISDESKFSGTFEFGLPLSFRTNNLAIIDTLPFRMLGDSSLAKIVDGKLITYIDNGLPVEFYFQAYFLDENFVIQDSLFASQQLVKPASISNDGRVSVPSVQSFVTLLDIIKTDRVKHMRHIYPVFRVRSIPVGNYVKIYNDFSLEFKIVGDLRFNLLSQID